MFFLCKIETKTEPNVLFWEIKKDKRYFWKYQGFSGRFRYVMGGLEKFCKVQVFLEGLKMLWNDKIFSGWSKN